MSSNTSDQDDSRGNVRSSLRGTPLSRRDLGKYAAVAAGLAALVPAVAGAQTPEASPAATPSAPSTLGTPSPDRPRGGSVTVARAGDSDSLDPAHTTAGISFQVFNNIYDTLIGFNADLTYEGILAESWDISDDGLTYTFHLRKGITFHDGTDFNADAVKFTFDRLMDPKTAAPAAGWVTAIKGSTVIDPSTVTIDLSTPFSPLLGNIALSYFGIVSPTAVQKYGDDFSTNPVGTGPWKFKEWVQGDH
ncbi:MAG TPA: ABC transporter substrate-binding protein, partial [Thermomicrobiales bacterium]|nr:ABC transporter substrate-binding protein [Thermomicrobiales bacterium]